MLCAAFRIQLFRLKIFSARRNYHTKSSEKLSFRENKNKRQKKSHRPHSLTIKIVQHSFLALFSRKNSFSSFQIPWTRIVIFLNIITLHLLLSLTTVFVVQGEKFFLVRRIKIIIIVFSFSIFAELDEEEKHKKIILLDTFLFRPAFQDSGAVLSSLISIVCILRSK